VQALQQREHLMSGWVEFPVNDLRYDCAAGGGLTVKMVVLSPKQSVQGVGFDECHGARVQDLFDGSLIGDSTSPAPMGLRDYRTDFEYDEALAQYGAWAERHMPNYRRLNREEALRLLSQSYLASMVMGSTSWVGWHRQSDTPWICSLADLSPQGLDLYDRMTRLYPCSDIRLLTFMSS